MTDSEFNTWGVVKLFVMAYIQQVGHKGTLTFTKIHKAVDDITAILEALIASSVE